MKRHPRLITGLVIGTLVLALPGYPAEIARRHPSALAGVKHLDKPVTYTETKIPLGELAARVAREEVASPKACAEMLAIMRRQQYLDQVPRYLSYSPYIKELQLPDDFTVACKTGFFPGTRVDAGLITMPKGKIA